MAVQDNLDDGARTAFPELTGAKPDPDFARVMAHKLGNLLQVVNGNLELLSARIEDSQLRNYLANAQTAAHELTAMARELVDASRDGEP